MTRVAVTGGAGFIGSNLVSALTNKGHRVSVIDDLTTGFLSNLEEGKSIFHKVSVVDFAELSEALADAEVIFHLGAHISVSQSIVSPVAHHQANATGTVNVLEVARKTGAHVLVSSSSAVYGSNPALPKDELMWLAPMTPYGASKMAAEAYVQAYASSYDIPVTLMRFFNVFGPRQRPDHEYAAVLPKWIWNAMHGKAIDVYGDGTQTRDFTYVDSIVDICLNAMDRRVTHDGPINIAFGNRISLLETIEKLRGYFPDLQTNFLPARPGDIKESQSNPALLNQLFPGVVSEDFDGALAQTVRWLRGYADSQNISM